MLYEYHVSVPAGTPETDPVEQLMKLSRMLITRIDIGFPDGVYETVRVRVYRLNRQIVPTNPEEYVTGNNQVIPVPMYYYLRRSPYALTAKLTSPGASYSHTVTIRVYGLPIKAARRFLIGPAGYL